MLRSLNVFFVSCVKKRHVLFFGLELPKCEKRPYLVGRNKKNQRHGLGYTQEFGGYSCSLFSHQILQEEPTIGNMLKKDSLERQLEPSSIQMRSPISLIMNPIERANRHRLRQKIRSLILCLAKTTQLVSF